jgi:AGCS family alanine or glycine:cation symporter
MIPNLIAVVALLPLVLKITRNYVDRKIRGLDVAPILSYDADIQAEMEKDLDND